MKRKAGNYYAEVLKRERINDLKCYFVQSNNPDFRYDDYAQRNIRSSKEEKTLFRNSRMEANGSVIAENFKDETGFALVWKPDVIMCKLREDLRGFGIKGYGFPKLNEMFVNNLCQLNAEIIGAESAILRDSETKDDYLSTWCLQSRFGQKHKFEL